MKIKSITLFKHFTGKQMPVTAPVLVSALLIGLSLTSTPNLAQAACIIDPSAWVLVSEVSCENNLDQDVVISENVRVVVSAVAGGTELGARTQVLLSDLVNVKVGPDSHIIKAQMGSFENEVRLGAGAFVDRGVRVSIATIGANAQINANARIIGGRGIDAITIGDNLVLGWQAELRIRRLGDNAVIGNKAYIGESTSAGDNLKFGARSDWTIGGSMGNNVSIGNNVAIEGGVDIDDGATVGSNSSIGVIVRIGANANVGARATLGNMSTVGANALLDQNVVIDNGATIGEGVVIRRNAQVGENAMVGAGSIIGLRAIIPIGAQIPPNSFVASDGTITPRPE